MIKIELIDGDSGDVPLLPQRNDQSFCNLNIQSRFSDYPIICMAYWHAILPIQKKMFETYDVT